MRVHVVSDVHGNTEALARAGDGADVLIVLGDLVDFVDYHDHSAGILGRVFGPEVTARFAELRRSGLRGELRAFIQSLWTRLDDPAAVIEHEVRGQYEQLFGSLTAPTYATPGNVDLPHLWPEYAGSGVTVCDGTVVEIGEQRVGFVGGALLPDGVSLPRHPVWRPYLRTPQDYAAAVAGLAEVDVLATHIPPAVAELCYDVVARHPELGSPHLLDLIHRQRPRLALFGHVHQPLAPRMRVGRTECVNVGHFKRTEIPHVLHW